MIHEAVSLITFQGFTKTSGIRNNLEKSCNRKSAIHTSGSGAEAPDTGSRAPVTRT